jgi:hypothetical protein
MVLRSRDHFRTFVQSRFCPYRPTIAAHQPFIQAAEAPANRPAAKENEVLKRRTRRWRRLGDQRVRVVMGDFVFGL